METTVRQETITVTFNGQDEEVRYHPHQKVEVILKEALDLFGIQQNRHLMALFNEDGVELDDKSSLADAGVDPGDVLILRQSTVRGGL